MRNRPVLPSDPHRLSKVFGLSPWYPAVALVALALSWAFPIGAGADVYKWTDAAGKVHYGDSPPHGHKAQSIRTPPPPPGSAVLQSRSRLDGLRDRETGQERERLREQEKQAAAREQAKRKQRCLQAQNGLAVLELDRPVFHVDEKGNRVYLTDDERAAKLDRLRRAVKADCR